MKHNDTAFVRLRANLQSLERPMHVHAKGEIGKIVESLQTGWWLVELGTWHEAMPVNECDFEVLREAVVP